MKKQVVLPITIKQTVIILTILIVIALVLNRFKGKASKPEDIEPYMTLALTPLPESGDSKGETVCRNFLTHMFKVPFEKARPNFLKNPITAVCLEIDCFNEDLCLGVEYNGRQHYQYTPHFHKNYESFRLQQYRDEIKRRLCKDNGITLVEVPYTVRNIPKYLHSKLTALGYLK